MVAPRGNSPLYFGSVQKAKCGLGAQVQEHGPHEFPDSHADLPLGNVAIDHQGNRRPGIPKTNDTNWTLIASDTNWTLPQKGRFRTMPAVEKAWRRP